MMVANSETRYGLVSKVLHWLMAAGVIGLIGLGWWMVGLDYYSPWYHDAPALHKSIGIVVFAVALATVLWHRASAKPQPQEDLKPWEKAAAAIAHVVLLAAALLIPITGYIATTSAGEGVSFFGLFEVPALLAKDDALRDLANDIHFFLSYGLVAVILVHAGAALKHQFIDGHDTLRRMLDK